MQFIIYEPLEKAGHKYKSRKINPHPPPKYLYEYEEGAEPKAKKPTKKELAAKEKERTDKYERVGPEDADRGLYKIGEWLFHIDEVREKNEMGFNKLDRQTWGRSGGSMPVNKKRALLKKYKRQIIDTHGEALYFMLGLGENPADWAKEPIRGFWRWHKTFGNFNFRLEELEYGDKRFYPLLNLKKRWGMFNSQDRDTGTWWTVVKDPNIDWPKFKAELEEVMGVPVDLPDQIPDQPKVPTAKELAEKENLGDGGSFDRVAKMLANEEPGSKNLAAVRWNKDKDSYEFVFPRGAISALFSNKRGMLPSIVRWNQQTQPWTTTVFDHHIAKLAMEKMRAINPDIHIVEEGWKEATEETERREAELQRPIPAVAEKLNPEYKLFPYQNEGVRFLHETDGKAILGDEMGLGKTLQCLAYLVSGETPKKAVVVVPKNVRRQWLTEADKFFPDSFVGKELDSAELLKTQRRYKAEFEAAEKKAKAAAKAAGHSDDQAIANAHFAALEQVGSEADYVVKALNLTNANLATINYESLDKFAPYLKAAGFNTIIMDESHRMKNPDAKVTKAIINLSKKMPHRILMSGTAIKNRRGEFATQLGLVAPGVFGGKKQIESNMIGELWDKMRPYYLARQKSKVLKDLPDKTTTIAQLPADKAYQPDLPSDLKGVVHNESAMAYVKALKEGKSEAEAKDIARDAAEKMELRIEEMIEEARSGGVFTRRQAEAELGSRESMKTPEEMVADTLIRRDIANFSKTLHALAYAKAASTISFVKENLDATDSNFLVFTESKATAKKIAKELGAVAQLHTGDESQDKKEAIKARFDPATRKEDETARVIVATRQSLAEGANLTSIDKVVFNDLPWTPADIAQAEARTHRPGQVNPVNVYWIQAEDNEMDALITATIHRKIVMHKKQVEGGQFTPEELAWMDAKLTTDEVLRQLRGESGDPTQADSIPMDTKSGETVEVPKTATTTPVTKATPAMVIREPKAKAKAKAKAKPEAEAPKPALSVLQVEEEARKKRIQFDKEREARAKKRAEPKPEPVKGYRYIDGDKVEYTGKSEMLHGEMAYETRYVEGHRKGQIRTTYHPPDPGVGATKAEEHAGAGSQPKQMTISGETKPAAKPVQLALFKSMADQFVLFRDDFDMDMERVDNMLKSFDFDGALDLIKAAGHKYLRRIPTGKQKPRWRYVYAETSKHHRKTFKVGEKVQITHGDQKGHYEVTAVHPNGYVTIKHDETGHYLSMKAEHLHEEFQKEHADKIKAAYKRLKQTVAAANVHGTEKQKSRARIQLAEFERRWGLGRFEEKGPAPKLIAKPEPKVKAEPEARVPVAASMDPNKVVPNDQIPAKIDELAKLGMKALKDMSVTLEEQRLKAEAEGKGTPVSMLRWGRILDGAMALVGTAEKVKEQKAKPKPKKRGRKKMHREDRTRFGTKDEAWAAILSASGDMEGLENTLSAEKAYDAWKRGKGPKPPPYEYGETDAINQALDLAKPLRHQRHKMKDNRVSSIRDGFDRLTAGAKTWADLEHAIEVLRQVPGLESIQLPEKVQQRLDAERMAVEEQEYFDEQKAYYDAQQAESEDGWDRFKDDPDHEPGVQESMDESELDTSFDFGANVFPDTGDETPEAGFLGAVGEDLEASRKELAAQERKRQSVFVPKSGGDPDFEYLSDPELKKLAHKEKLMDPFNPEDFLAQGYDPGYVAVRGAIEKLVSKAPPVANRMIQESYIKGIAFLQKGMDRCQTVQDLKEFMEEWNRLCYGSRRAGAFESSDELWNARDAKLKAQGKKLIMSHDEYKKLQAKKEALYSRMLHQTVQEDNSEAGRKLKAEHGAVKKEMEQYEYGNVEGELASYYGDGMRQAIRLAMDIPEGSEIDFERHGARLVVYQRDPDLDRGLKFDSKRVGKKGEEALATYNDYFKMAGSIGQAGTRGVQYGLNTFGKTSKAIRDAVRLAERWDDQRLGRTVYPEGKKLPEESMEVKREKINKLLTTKKQKSSDRFTWRHTMTGKPERIGGKPISKADAKVFASEFNLRGIKPGEYVTKAELAHHIMGAHGAFSDLADVLELDPKQLSFGGRLGLGIGSHGRGHGAASFLPQQEIISITKFAGGGSLAHEWGHALDNILAKWARPEGAPTKIQTGPLEYRAVHISHGDAPDLDQDVLRAYNRIQSMMYHGDPDAYEKEGGTDKTSKFYDASRGMTKAPSSYYTSPHEMFARAFESYVHDKLQADGGRANTYLVSGTTREEIAAAEKATRLTGSAREIMVPYPEGDERKQLMLLFDDFTAALRKKDMLKKSLLERLWERLSGSRELFVIPLERL